jgi:sugar transferase (PEP-CTERM/EpsH1 system associated)
MRILFLTHRLPYAPNRGDRIRAYYLMREMARFAKVSLFALAHDAEEASHVADVPFADEVRCVRISGVRNHINGFLRLPSNRPLTHSLLDSPRARTVLNELVNTAPPDLVVAFCSGIARLALEPPILGLPLAIDFVDVDSSKWAQLADEVGPPMRWIYRREARTLAAFEREVAERAGLALVCNERERRELMALAPRATIHVVESGIDVESFKPRAAPELSTTVIFTGVMNYEPNRQGVLWFAEHVWPKVRAIRPDAKFLVVGTNPPADVRSLAKRDPSIHVTGHVATVEPYLAVSAVAVAPLLVARGMQNKAIEALAAGVPVVVTPAVWEGLPDCARRASRCADDPGTFASAVVTLLQATPDERRALAARADIESLAWPRQLASLESLLTSVARAATRP